MDDEFTPDQDVEASEQTEPAEDDKRHQKLQKENESLRRRLRTFEAAEKYGKDYAEVIPDSLPISEWDGFVEKLKAKFPATQAAPEPETPQPEAPAEPTEQEKRLAAVTQVGQGQVAPTTALSAEDAWNLYLQNPGQYKAMKDTGSLKLPKLPGANEE